MNILSNERYGMIITLLEQGFSLREVARRTRSHRSAVKRAARDLAKRTSNLPTGNDGQNVPTCRPGFSRKITPQKKMPSLCEPHRAWIEEQVGRGRHAVAIHDDLTEMRAYKGRYDSVRRFVQKLRHREPERFDVLMFPPGEEAQVDYGQGEPMPDENGKMKRPYLFVMTLKYSGMAFRKVVWKTSQEAWARLHEEAFRHFGGVPRFVVLDNLKEGVIKPDLYEPEINRVYAAMLAHYGAVADPCRVADPNRKGTVERAIQHTQDYLKGREFKTIEEQNAFLRDWDEKRASQRIHGSKKRRVVDMFLEEKPDLLPLPAAGFRYFTEEERKVDHAGLVMVKGNYYAALPAPLYLPVKVRIYDDEIVIAAQDGAILRRHRREAGKGKHVMEPQDFMFNPSRDTAKLLEKARKIGPGTTAVVEAMFRRLGRAAHGTIYGLVGLIRTYAKEDIERACARASQGNFVSYRAIKAILERTAKPREAPDLELQQQAPEIRPIADYQRFWDLHARGNNAEETKNGNDNERGREGAEGSATVRYAGHA